MRRVRPGALFSPNRARSQSAHGQSELKEGWEYAQSRLAQIIDHPSDRLMSLLTTGKMDRPSATAKAPEGGRKSFWMSTSGQADDASR